MASKEIVNQRFTDLLHNRIQVRQNSPDHAEPDQWGYWSSSALNLVQIIFGESSAHYQRLKQIIEKNEAGEDSKYQEALGMLSAAKTDYERGCYISLERMVSGEVFADFVAAAKRALAEENKDVAAVLACAALEDALKRLAQRNGLNVDGKDMSEVIGALKSKGLVGGSQKSILETMPKTRNSAMHADWAKISATEVGGVIGFTEQFLLQNF
jgi:hypothetical protein